MKKAPCTVEIIDRALAEALYWRKCYEELKPEAGVTMSALLDDIIVPIISLPEKRAENIVRIARLIGNKSKEQWQ